MTSIITLLTDFGLKDAYVGLMKGVILNIRPEAIIVDISHGIDPQDRMQTALVAGDVYRYFPKNSVHIIVVDPGVGSDRSIIAMQREGNVYLAPDNGVLTLLLDDKVEKIVRVTNDTYFLKPISRTFHGRDIFAPVGAHLSAGLAVTKLGPLASPSELNRMELPQPFISEDGLLNGEVVATDSFGNLITNLSWGHIESHHPEATQQNVVFKLGRDRIAGLSSSYRDAGVHRPLAVIGSRGTIEFAVNCGSAESYFHRSVGSRFKVRISASASRRRDWP